MSERISYGKSEKISLKINLVYGIGNMGTSLLTGIFDGAVVKYYTDKVFLQPIFIGIAFLIYAIWNALNDPIIGFLSDNTRTKIGRRIPYMRITSFIFGIAFILVWFPPSPPLIGSQLDTFWYLLITILLFDTVFTIYGLCIIALLPELSLDPNERTKLSVYLTVFGIVGTVIAFLIPFIFLTTTGGKEQFQFLCIIIAIIATICFFIASFTLKERLDFYDKSKSFGVKDNFIYCLKSKSFICYVLYNFGLTLVSSNIVTMVLYYTQYVLYLGGETSILPLVIIFIGFLATYFVSNRIQQKFGIRKSLMIFTTFGIIGFLLVLVPSFITAIIAISIFASSIAIYSILINPMMADVCDEDEIRTGLRREGSYFGMNALITKPSISLGVFIITFILEYSQYFPKLTEYFGYPQSVGVEIGIRIMIGVVPAIILAICLIPLYFYPLHGSYGLQVKEEIKKRHSGR